MHRHNNNAELFSTFTHNSKFLYESFLRLAVVHNLIDFLSNIITVVFVC